MKEFILNIIKKHKVIAAILLFFIIWMLFVDEYNLFRIRRDSKKLKNLKKESIYLNEKIEKDRKDLYKLKNDVKELERFAREEYLLKKEDEEVYIIIEE